MIPGKAGRMMRFLKNRDGASGLFLAVFSAWAFYSADSFSRSSISTYGNPAVVPRIVTAIIFVLAVLILLDGVKEMKTRPADLEISAQKKRDAKEQLPEIMTFLLLTIYVMTIKKIGFVITTAAYLFLQMFILSCFDTKRIWLFLLIACIISPALFYGFRTFFDVLLPAGALGWNP